MPSPIAHSALLLVAGPALTGPAGATLGRRRRALLAAGLLLALNGPDLDLLVAAVAPAVPPGSHGTVTHGLGVALLFAPVFALFVRAVVGPSVTWARAAAVGALCVGLHGVLDALTWGRGVWLLWPLSSERLASPWPLFYGVRRGWPPDWSAHALTVANDLAFAGLAWLAARTFGSHLHPRPAERVADASWPATDDAAHG